MSTETLANLLYSILQYNLNDNQLENLTLYWLKLTGSADFYDIYAQIENVSYLEIEYLQEGSDDEALEATSTLASQVIKDSQKLTEI